MTRALLPSASHWADVDRRCMVAPTNNVQWCAGWQPVTMPRTAMKSANVISDGRIHFDCVTATITSVAVLYIFMNVLF